MWSPNMLGIVLTPQTERGQRIIVFARPPDENADKSRDRRRGGPLRSGNVARSGLALRDDISSGVPGKTEKVR